MEIAKCQCELIVFFGKRLIFLVVQWMGGGAPTSDIRETELRKIDTIHVALQILTILYMCTLGEARNQ